MAVGSFEIGQRLTIGETRFRIDRELERGTWQLEEIATGRVFEHKTEALLKKWETGELHFSDGQAIITKPNTIEAAALNAAVVDAFQQSCPPTLWRRAEAKLIFVRKLLKIPITQSIIVPIIEDIWKCVQKSKYKDVFGKPPHFTTVASWIRMYRYSGDDIRSLVNRDVEKGSTSDKLNPKIIQIMDDVIESDYLSLERPTMADAYHRVKGLIAKENVGRLPSEYFNRPSFSAFRRKIEELPKYDVCVARFGKRIADIKFRAAGSGALAEKPLVRASMDHGRLDLMVVDEKNGLPLGRPWLTLVLDEHSRYVLGFYIEFDEPSNVSVSHALRHALMPKTTQLELYPAIKNAWDAWGVMGTLVVDNGLDFHGQAIEEGTGRFGIKVQFCPRKQPWYKGKIERMFGTVNTGFLTNIPGKTFSNIFEKADYNPAKTAVVKLSTLREMLLTWIVDIYHQTIHRGIGTTPAEAWRQGIQSVDRWLPSNSISVETAFGKVEKRRLTHKGVEFDSLFYNSHDLRLVRELYGSEIDVEIRVIDDNIGSIIVVSPENKTLIRVPALDVDYASGMNRWQHKVCKRYQRRLMDDQSREISLFDARERIRELVRADMGLVKRDSRKRQARFMQNVVPLKPNDDVSAMPSMAPIASPLSTPVPAKIVNTENSIHEDSDDVPVFAGRRL